MSSATNNQDLLAQLAALQAVNAKLVADAARKDNPTTPLKDGISCRVSTQGAVSVYGMGRFPVTLYKEQWAKVLNSSEEIKAFITANDSKLKAKPVKAKATPVKGK